MTKRLTFKNVIKRITRKSLFQNLIDPGSKVISQICANDVICYSGTVVNNSTPHCVGGGFPQQ